MCSFLRGFILKLEKAQVADSISKVLEVQKFRNGKRWVNGRIYVQGVV
jgi:archaellum biogenesis ATPase FlaH